MERNQKEDKNKTFLGKEVEKIGQVFDNEVALKGRKPKCVDQTRRIILMGWSKQVFFFFFPFERVQIKQIYLKKLKMGWNNFRQPHGTVWDSSVNVNVAFFFLHVNRTLF